MRAEMSPDLKQITPEAKEAVAQIDGATEVKEGLAPEQNEDTAFFNKDRMTAGVLDGMGGGMAGGEASKLAGKIISRELRKISDGVSLADCKKAINSAILDAHQTVLELGNNKFFQYLDSSDRENWKKETGNLLWDDPAQIDQEMAKTGWIPAAEKFKGKSQDEIFKAQKEAKITTPTGSTASVAKLIERPDGGTEMVYGHVGDSRIYVLRKNGKIEQVTQDEGGFKEAVEKGVITQEEADVLDQITDPKILEEKFDKDKAEYLQRLFPHIRRSITQGLGLAKEIKPQIGSIKLEPGERVLFTSDGIHDNLTDKEIEQLLKGGSPTEAASKIVSAAKARIAEGTMRSKKDDKTAIVLEVPEATEEISAEDIEEEPEEVVELGEGDVEAIPIEVLEAEDKRKSAEEAKKIRKAIGI